MRPLWSNSLFPGDDYTVMNRRHHLCTLLLGGILLSGCGSGDRDEFAGLSTEEQFYREALSQLNSSNFIGAIATYEALESRFPFGRFAAQAQIEIVYAYYRNGDMESARAAADRFIGLHPDNENVDYAYYMKGLSSFSASGGLANRFLPIDPTKRDPKRYEEAFNDFAQLLTLYPESPYAADARARMVFLRNSLAAYEIHVARYYLKRRAYVAALRRGQYVVENFQGTPAVADGMAIMTECYLRMGLNDLAGTSLALLQENYPNHGSLDRDGQLILGNDAFNPSLLHTITFGLLGSDRGSSSIAPTIRPETSGSRQIIEYQEREQEQQEREPDPDQQGQQGQQGQGLPGQGPGGLPQPGGIPGQGPGGIPQPGGGTGSLPGQQPLP